MHPYLLFSSVDVLVPSDCTRFDRELQKASPDPSIGDTGDSCHLSHTMDHVLACAPRHAWFVWAMRCCPDILHKSRQGMVLPQARCCEMWYTKEPNKFFQQDIFLIQCEPMTILPDLSDLVIEQVSITNEVTVTVRAASPTASCPCCGTISKRVQSRYTRTLRDLPASGRPVELIVCVRRFFCQESTCVRKIFAERFPSLTLPRVKFTLRLQETLRQMGFALGGEAGARLGRQLSIPGSSDTLLRLVKQTELPVASSPRVVGIDDWSWKRRLRYGTLICDLENNKPIDVLSDREVETVSAWFENHHTVTPFARM